MRKRNILLSGSSSHFFEGPEQHVTSFPTFTRLDVGGTSTDVSRFDGRYEVVYETTTAGVTIQSPQLDINTVAAGGGSCLTFQNGLFYAGPHSAGAQPGPACYR
jgi:5-oxoprolinase (ATP-hydrolysing)